VQASISVFTEQLASGGDGLGRRLLELNGAHSNLLSGAAHIGFIKLFRHLEIWLHAMQGVTQRGLNVLAHRFASQSRVAPA
jgi:hypothetical protein